MVIPVCFIFFDLQRRLRYDIACYTSEILPDERYALVRSTLAAGKCNEGVFAMAAASIRVREAEFVRYGPAVEWCAEE